MTDPTKGGASPAESIVDALSTPEAAGIDFEPPLFGEDGEGGAGGRPRGRPRSLAGGAGGHRVTLYLDDASLEAARMLGQGNLSQGIRQALAMAANVFGAQPGEIVDCP